MHVDKPGDSTTRGRDPASWQERWRRTRSLVAAMAVGLVALAAMVALMISPLLPAPQQVALAQGDAPTTEKGVVMAPALTASPRQAAGAQESGKGAGAPANVLSAGLDCRNCGVVQMVVAVHEHAQPQASAYQMHIRMDDGSMRTVEQRGALAAGSRVIVERRSVRVLAERPTHG